MTWSLIALSAGFALIGIGALIVVAWSWDVR